MVTSMRTNEEWLHALTASDGTQDAAIGDLRDFLFRAVLFFFSRNLDDFRGLARDEILQLAEDCTQEALIAVMNHTSDFRGDSKFTTWAYKFAINKALMVARHERWKSISLDGLSSLSNDAPIEWAMQEKLPVPSSDQSMIQAEVIEVIREVIEHELTDKQRRVLIMMVFNEVPMDEVVRHLGTNRNAIYKMLHDARRKLKIGLQARGFDVAEMLILFSITG